MANKGKRMVFEEDIKKIGTGGSSKVKAEDLEAGYGVVIEQDLEADKPLIKVDNTEIAAKSDLSGFVSDETLVSELQAHVTGKSPVVTQARIVGDDSYFDIYLDDKLAPTDNINGYVAYDSLTDYEDPVTHQMDMGIPFDQDDVDTENLTIDISAFINQIPLLQADCTTDWESQELPNVRLYRAKDYCNNNIANYKSFKGFVMIKDTVNNKYIIICSAGNNNLSEVKMVPAGTTPTTFTVYQNYMPIHRVAGNGYMAKDVRVRRYHGLFMDDAYAAQGYNYKVNGVVVPKENIIMIGLTGLSGETVYIDNNGVSANIGVQASHVQLAGNTVNFASQLRVPSAQGDYTLKCHIDANGACTGFEWVADSQ